VKTKMTEVMCIKCKKKLFVHQEEIHPKRLKYLIKRLMNDDILGVWRLTDSDGMEVSRAYFHPHCLKEEYAKLKDRECQKEFYLKMVTRLTNIKEVKKQ